MDVNPIHLNNKETARTLTAVNLQPANEAISQKTPSTPVLGDNISSESTQILKEVLQISDVLNRKVKFSVDTDSNRVIIRILDKETNEIVRELPPEALVKLHKKMKEAMGILGVFVDQKA